MSASRLQEYRFEFYSCSCNKLTDLVIKESIHGEIVINIILDIWLDVAVDNSYISVFYIPQDVLDVRLLNQLTETESDHRAFVPIIQYKKGAI